MIFGTDEITADLSLVRLVEHAYFVAVWLHM